MTTPTPSSKSLQRAAQAWCAATTSHKEMDAALATEFARILDADLAAREAELAAMKAENSKLRSALEIVHFKREPWQ